MYSPKKCGIKYSPPTLVLIYEDTVKEKTKRRSIPLKKLTNTSAVEEVVDNLYSNCKHSVYLAGIPRVQIEGLVGKIIRELAENSPRVLPQLPRTSTPTPTSTAATELDLNKLGDLELKREKEKMDVLFEKNKVRQETKDFEYDIEVDFEGVKLESGWDSGDDVIEF